MREATGESVKGRGSRQKSIGMFMVQIAFKYVALKMQFDFKVIKGKRTHPYPSIPEGHDRERTVYVQITLPPQVPNEGTEP